MSERFGTNDPIYDMTRVLSLPAAQSSTDDAITDLIGDVTASGPGAVTATLATVNANVGTFGSATQSPQVTVNAKGLITNVANVTISGVVPSAHDILSSQHGDTLAAAVVRGDLIVGNATPKWSRLAIGAANKVLQSDGTDTAWSNSTLTISGNSTINGSLVGNMTGGGTVATGGLTLTIPATGNAAIGAGTLTVSTTNDATGASHTHAITSSSNPGAAAAILASGADGGLRLTGIGIAAAAIPGSIGNNVSLSVTGTGYAPTSFYYYGNNSVVAVNLASNSQADWRVYGMEASVGVSTASVGTMTNVFGGSFLTLNSGTGAVTNQTSGRFIAQSSIVTGTAPTTNLKVGQFSSTKSGSGTWTITTQKTLSVEIPTVSAGTLSGTTIYGLYLENFGAPGGTWTNKYAVYSAGGQWSINGGADELQFDLLGFTTQTATVARIRRNDGATNTVNSVVTIGANSTGTAANGFGARQLWTLESSTTADQSAAALDVSWTTATHATRKAKAVVKIWDTSERTAITFESDGVAAKTVIAAALETSVTSTAVDLALSSVHHRVLVTATGKTITLPTAVGITGREYSIKSADGCTTTIATTSSQTIDGATSATIGSNVNIVVFSDGANWRIG